VGEVLDPIQEAGRQMAHIAKKGNRYYPVAYGGINPVTGDGKRDWHDGFATRKEAEREAAEIVKRKQDGDYRSPDRITLGDYLNERWLPTRRAQIRPSTFSAYKNSIAIHVVPRIGSIQLRQLQPEDLDLFYAQLLVDGKRNGAGGGLAPKTVRNIHAMLRKALHDAERKGTVQRNVADLADPPKIKVGGSKAMTVWSADELRCFLSAIEDSDWYVPIYLAANTGMRRGEVLGVPWRNLDLDTGRLIVDQQVLSVEYQLEVADVKTSHSRRTVDLDPRTVAVLRAWRREQLERLMSTGVRNDSDFVFTHPEGGPVHPDFFSQSWNRLMRDHDVRRIRLHDLRHTHASILLKENVPPKVVSERLGHSSPAFTMTVYQHVLPGMQADAAAAFGDAVFGD
jgi:integrase